MTEVEIEIKAEEIRKQYNSEGLSPFPYQRIQDKNKNLFFVEMEMTDKNISGACLYYPDDDRFVIAINKSKSQTRKNFTIGHEIGHYILHEAIVKNNKVIIDKDECFEADTGLFRFDNGVTDVIETEANRFAAALLMPSQLVEKAWKELSDVEECAKVFQVSLSAMSIRLDRLHLLHE